jgi:hypothetical protein
MPQSWRSCAEYVKMSCHDTPSVNQVVHSAVTYAIVPGSKEPRKPLALRTLFPRSQRLTESDIAPMGKNIKQFASPGKRQRPLVLASHNFASWFHHHVDTFSV